MTRRLSWCFAQYDLSDDLQKRESITTSRYNLIVPFYSRTAAVSTQRSRPDLGAFREKFERESWKLQLFGYWVAVNSLVDYYNLFKGIITTSKT